MLQIWQEYSKNRSLKGFFIAKRGIKKMANNKIKFMMLFLANMKWRQASK
jgi:hypothetical protein